MIKKEIVFSANKKFFVPLLVLVIGVAWFVAEFYWIGLAARWFYVLFDFPYGMPPLEMRILSVLSTVLVQLVPSLITALIVSLIKPRRWLLYSCLVIIPQIVTTVILSVREGPSAFAYTLFWFTVVECLFLIQVPLLLLLIYRLGNIRSARGSRTKRLNQQSA